MELPHKMREPAVAGSFYPDDEKELREMIEKFLKDAGDVKVPGKLRGLVVPHAGYVYSGPTAAYGYKVLMEQKKQPDQIFLFGPAHYGMFVGIADSGYDIWKTPLGMVNTKSISSKITDRSLVHVYPRAHDPEHSLEVQLPFLQTVMKEQFTAYPVLTGEVSPASLANAVEPVLDEDSLFLVSSDLSHYHPYENAKRIDSVANESVPNLDFKKAELFEACGKTAILTLMQTAKSKGWKGKLLDYRNSGDTAGPRDGVVGYGAYAFYE